MNSKFLVAVLTKDEQDNIEQCLDSVVPLGCDVLVVDSGSTDSTVSLAEARGAEVVFHPFESIAQQRNWVLEEYGNSYDWVLFLDADERLSAGLAEELAALKPPGPAGPFGYYIFRHFYFLGKRLRHGEFARSKVLRLLCPARSRVVEQTRTLEYAKVDGPVGILKNPLIHENRKPLSDWIRKHDWYSTREAEDEAAGMGFHAERVSENPINAFLNATVGRALPPLLRPFALFAYSYVFRLGFLDGKAGLIYYFLHDFWYPLLTAAKLHELKLGGGGPSTSGARHAR